MNYSEDNNSNPLKILIVEDEPIVAAALERELSKSGYQVVGVIDTGEEAMEFAGENTFDLILMDVELGGDIDGIDASHMISKENPVPIIFLTANTDSKTFNRAKLTQPIGFLSKPYRITDLKHSIAMAFRDPSNSEIAEQENEQETISYQVEHSIFVKSRDFLVRIRFSKIQYVEADSCYCTIVTSEGSHTIVSTLKKFESSIAFPHLMRIHLSYIINLNYIDKIGESMVVIDKKQIPISRSYREAFFAEIKRY